MAWRVFYSYSHKDADLRERLGTYLAPLKQQLKISEWYDRKIEPGANWDTAINDQLDSADLILLLVSADFLASEYCFGVEVEKVLARLKRAEVKVVPVLLRPCLWEESRFSELQIIPRDAKAITSWASVDEALRDVASEIRKLVSEAPPSQPTSSSGAHEPRLFDGPSTWYAARFAPMPTCTREHASGCDHRRSERSGWSRSSRRCAGSLQRRIHFLTNLRSARPPGSVWRQFLSCRCLLPSVRFRSS